MSKENPTSSEYANTATFELAGGIIDELKKELAEVKRKYNQDTVAYIKAGAKAEAVNAELLEALKNATNKSYQFGLTPYVDDLGNRWIKYEQRISESDYNKYQSAIAKAECKTI